MADGVRRSVAPVRKLVAAVLGTFATFVILFGCGMPSWAIVALGVALLVLAIGLGLVTTVRSGARAWVAGIAHVHSVSEPPASSVFGRCELQIVLDAPGLPPRSIRVRDPRVPVTKWPSPGSRAADHGRDRRPTARTDPLGRGAHPHGGRRAARPAAGVRRGPRPARRRRADRGGRTAVGAPGGRRRLPDASDLAIRSPRTSATICADCGRNRWWCTTRRAGPSCWRAPWSSRRPRCHCRAGPSLTPARARSTRIPAGRRPVPGRAAGPDRRPTGCDADRTTTTGTTPTRTTPTASRPEPATRVRDGVVPDDRMADAAPWTGPRLRPGSRQSTSRRRRRTDIRADGAVRAGDQAGRRRPARRPRRPPPRRPSDRRGRPTTMTTCSPG